MGRIGFVGLGTMGAPMAGHLAAANHEVLAWNRSPDRPTPEGVQRCHELQDLRDCEAVCLCINRSEDVLGVLELLKPQSQQLIIDHSTISPKVTREIHQSHPRFVDAPITGGSMGAKAGKLTIFLGGTESNCQEAATWVEPYAKVCERVGGPGSGQMMKLANQIAVGGALLALCESLAFAQRAGLDIAQARQLLSGGAAGSWAFEHYGPKILAEDWAPGFSIKNQRKDFEYLFEAAKILEAQVPGTELVDALLAHVENPEETTCALFKHMAGTQ